MDYVALNQRILEYLYASQRLTLLLRRRIVLLLDARVDVVWFHGHIVLEGHGTVAGSVSAERDNWRLSRFLRLSRVRELYADNKQENKIK